MNKERLEEIKNSFLEGQHILFGTSWVSMPKESFDWLIKQVEKMEQLQQENEKEQKRLKNQIYKTAEEKFLLEKQNKRYQEAIEKALDESGWGDEGYALNKIIGILTKVLEDEE